MKRLLVVILSLVYFAASSGFTLRQHYCMGELIGTAIDHPVHEDSDTHNCERCGMEKTSDDNGCCQDKVKTFKASPDQLPAKAFHVSPAPVVAILPVAFSLPASPALSSESAIVSAPPHGPPGQLSELPIYLRIRSLLI